MWYFVYKIIGLVGALKNEKEEEVTKNLAFYFFRFIIFTVFILLYNDKNFVLPVYMLFWMTWHVMPRQWH